MSATQNAYLCAGLRTPFARYGGGLADIRPDDLAALTLHELIKRQPNIDPAAIDDVILGCANQSGEDNRNVARMALLLAGLPPSVPGITVNRLCASGLDAVIAASRNIRLKEGNLILAGGVESMTRAPLVMGKPKAAYDRMQKLEDTTMGWRFINPRLKELYGVDTMPQTAETVAREFHISRSSQDAFALRSQERYSKANAKGLFQAEILPVALPLEKGQREPVVLSKDEHPRETTLEGLAKLKGVVENNGTVTAGNSSGINDGAVALTIASEEAIKRFDLKPIVRIVSGTAVGVLPRIMGIGPVPAIQKILEMNKLTLQQIDLLEINEAFAAQAVAVLRELRLPEDADFVNPNGGAIALGHPLGASGARLALHAALELQRRQGRYAICSLCVGVGQGSALLLERV